MTATSYKNGHKIHYNFDFRKWYYEDGQRADIDERPCPKCNNISDKNGHDACIKNLPGVKNACCGHGVEDGYIQFLNGKTIRFELKNIEP